MNVNFSAEDLRIDANVAIGSETTEIEKADVTIESSYGEGEVVVTLSDPSDARHGVSFRIADTRVETLCDALLAVAKKTAQGGNTFID